MSLSSFQNCLTDRPATRSPAMIDRLLRCTRDGRGAGCNWFSHGRTRNMPEHFDAAGVRRTIEHEKPIAIRCLISGTEKPDRPLAGRRPVLLRQAGKSSCITTAKILGDSTR